MGEISRCRQSHEPQRPLPRSFILPRLRVSLSSTDQHRNYGRLSSYHPNVSKDDLRAKLAEVYKSNKDQINVFGMRTQYGGGKSTGFALIYDSVEAMKKFEPHYRLVRVGHATKIEKASRQQRKQ